MLARDNVFQQHLGASIASVVINSVKENEWEKKNAEGIDKKYKSIFQTAEEQNEIIQKRTFSAVNAAVVAGIQAKDDRLSNLSGLMASRFSESELMLDRNERIRFVMERMFKETQLSDVLSNTVSMLAVRMVDHFAIKDKVFEVIRTPTTSRNQVSFVLNPTLTKFSQLMHSNKEDTKVFASVLSDIINNFGKNSGQRSWRDESKSVFALVLDYGGPALLRQLNTVLHGPSLSTLYKEVRLPYQIPNQLEDSTFARAKIFFDKMKCHGPFQIAIDATPVLPSLRIRGNEIYGYATGDKVIVRNANDIISVLKSERYVKARQVTAFMLAPLKVSGPFFILALKPVMKGETSFTVKDWYNTAQRLAAENGLHIVGLGADGDSKVRKFYLDTFSKDYIPSGQQLTLSYPTFNFAATLNMYDNEAIPSIMFPDWRHLFKKWRNQLLNMRKLLLLGKHVVQIEHLIQIYEPYKLDSGLWKSDVYVRDKQNVDAAIRILKPCVCATLRKWNDELTIGTQVYLTAGHALYQAFTVESLTPRERARLAWKPITFLRLWKKYLEIKNYDRATHFISMQTFTDTVLAGHSIILFMLINAKYYPDVAFPIKYLGSDVCEVLFAELRGFCKGKNNFSFLEMLDIAARVQKLQEIRSKFKSQQRMEQDTSEREQWPCNLESELITGMKNAEREILKTIQLLGMSNELIRSNVLFQNDHTGELTIVNLDSEAYIAQDCFPDELNVLHAEDLADLDNGVLLDALDNGQISVAHNLAEIVAESAQASNIENDRSALEEGDPRLCQYWNADGKCHYMDSDFTEPVNNKWVGCEFPDCGK